MIRPRLPSRLRHRGGFTMIEMLVAVLVLSLGLLGYASLLAATLRANQSANHRTIATSLSYEIIDAMRSDRQQAVFYQTDFGANPTATSSDPLWRQQLADWKQRVATTLPNGQGRIVMNTGVVVVTVRWTDDRSLGAAPTDQTTFVVESRL